MTASFSAPSFLWGPGLFKSLRPLQCRVEPPNKFLEFDIRLNCRSIQYQLQVMLALTILITGHRTRIQDTVGYVLHRLVYLSLVHLHRLARVGPYSFGVNTSLELHSRPLEWARAMLQKPRPQ